MNRSRAFRRGAWRLRVLILLSLLFAGFVSTRALSAEPCTVPAFSAAGTQDRLPPGWQPWILSRFKRETEYRLVEEEGVRVVEAHADRSASGLTTHLHLDPRVCRHLSWRWRIEAPIAEADLRKAAKDDAPARVFVVFEGDRKRFDFQERFFSAKIKLVTGEDLPYATLTYSWNDRLPAGSIFESPHTSRIRSIVLDNGGAPLGQWVAVKRDLVADFRAAFNEEPGDILSISLLTDGDNTRQTARAWYGDIALQAAAGQP